MKYLAMLLVLFSSLALGDTKTFSCDYKTYSNKDGNHGVEQDFKITFIVDKDTNKSYILGNQGSSNVVKFETGNQISFVEVTESGNVMTTTIDSELKSVHSRNSVIADQLFPSQYYGECELK